MNYSGVNTYSHLGLEDAAEKLLRMEEAEATRREQEKLAAKMKDAQEPSKAVYPQTRKPARRSASCRVPFL